jgi:hypothetical protein
MSRARLWQMQRQWHVHLLCTLDWRSLRRGASSSSSLLFVCCCCFMCVWIRFFCFCSVVVCRMVIAAMPATNASVIRVTPVPHAINANLPTLISIKIARMLSRKSLGCLTKIFILTVLCVNHINADTEAHATQPQASVIVCHIRLAPIARRVSKITTRQRVRCIVSPPSIVLASVLATIALVSAIVPLVNDLGYDAFFCFLMYLYICRIWW